MLNRHLHLWIALMLAICARPLVAQDKAELQRRMEQWRGERDGLVARADAAWDREVAREKSGDCHSTSPRDYLECLGREIDTTKRNLDDYLGAFRAIFALASPDQDAWMFPGPTGTPPTADEFAREFDKVEASWKEYRSVMCGAAFDHDRGGTIAPVSASLCELTMMRSHMRELGAILGKGFHR